MSIISFTLYNNTPTFTLKGKSKRGIKKIKKENDNGVPT